MAHKRLVVSRSSRRRPVWERAKGLKKYSTLESPYYEHVSVSVIERCAHYAVQSSLEAGFKYNANTNAKKKP